MTLSKMMLAGVMLVAVPCATLAQQSLTGTISVIDRLNGTIVIKQTPSGTVGGTTYFDQIGRTYRAGVRLTF